MSFAVRGSGICQRLPYNFTDWPAFLFSMHKRIHSGPRTSLKLFCFRIVVRKFRNVLQNVHALNSAEKKNIFLYWLTCRVTILVYGKRKLSGRF